MPESRSVVSNATKIIGKPYGAMFRLQLFVDGETGLIVEERDTDGLAQALLAMLGNPERTREMGAAGRAFVEKRHNADILTRALETQYDELIGA